MEKKSRFLKYDWIRAIAIVAVILVHVSAYMVLAYPDVSTWEFRVGNLFNGLSRCGVPLFVMLTGALLLNEDKAFDAGKFYRRSLVTMVGLLVFWLLFYGVFYAALLPLLTGQPASFRSFWNYLLTFDGSDYPHLWYMFLVVGMYCMIPVLRLFVRRKNVKYIVGIVAASAVFQFLGKTLNLFTLNADTTVSAFLGKFCLHPVMGYIGYLLLGWLLDNYRMKKKFRITVYAAGLIALVGSTAAVQGLIETVPGIRGYVYDQLTFPAFVYGAAVFLLILTLCGEKQSSSPAICTVSRFSFGMYIIHVVPLEILTGVLFPYSGSGFAPALGYILLVYLIVIGVSFLLCLIGSKSRITRKILYIR